MRNISFILVLFLASCALETGDKSDEQEKYAPGTIGYVYESCKVSLEHETTFEAYQRTYCGRFLSGLMVGMINSNWIYRFQKENDPCKEARDIAYEHIEARKCNDVEQDENTKNDGSEFYYLINDWLAYIDNSGLKQEAFSQPAPKLWRYYTRQNQFCKYRAENPDSEKERIIINPALSQDLVKNFKKFFGSGTVPWDENYEGCKQDLYISKGSRMAFASTPCGAEILGYLAGLYSTKSLQENPPKIEGVCKSDIDALYDELDITARYCYNEDENILKLGSIYLKVADTLKKIAISEGRSKEETKISFGNLMSDVNRHYDNCEKRFR